MMALSGVACATVTLIATVGCRESSTPSSRRLTGSHPDIAASVTSVLARADSLYAASEFDSVVALLEPALEESRRRADSTTETRVLTRLGLTLEHQGELDGARRHLTDALELATARQALGEQLEARNGLGLVALDGDRYEDARQQFAEAIRLAEATHDRRARAKASGNLGLTFAYLGELRQARPLLVAMRDSAAALGERRYEANAMANIAMVDIWEGNALSAIPTLDAARALYRTIDYAPGEQNALGQLATAYEEIGEYSKAFAALDSSLSLARAKGMKEDEAEILVLVASLHARLGDYRAAMHSYDETAAVATRLDLPDVLGTVKRSTAAIHLELGDLARARADAEEAARIHRASAASFEVLDDLLTLAEVAQRARRPGESTALLDSARAIADSLGTRSGRLSVALTAARLADQAADAQRVLTILRGVDSTGALGDFAALAEMYSLMARAFARRDALDSAVAMGARAISAVERVRADLASEPLRRALLADRSAVYAEQVIVLLRLGREKEAFSIADAARSRGLVDYLASATTDLGKQAGGVRADEGEELLRQIDVLMARLKSIDGVPARERGPESATASTELMARLERARADYESFLVRAGREHPRAAALLGTRATSVDRVQGALDADEALLEYLVTDDRLVIFVATKSALRTFQVPGASVGLAGRVRLLRELWGTRDSDWRTGLPAARALHDVLLGTVMRSGALGGVRRLIVVPHGVLNQLPFGGLVDGRTGRFVAHDFEVLNLSSAGTLPALRPSGGSTNEPLGGAAFAPFPTDLPASVAEVAAVRRAIPGIAARLGADASEQAVRSALEQPGIVHVATHGMLNSRNPMFTRIELAGASSGSSGNDGRLEVHELLGAAVRSHLVFLSGCETGVVQSWLDDAVRGSDYTTLAQALLYAGAENVIGTLWRVDDAGAAAFAAEFYRPLSRLGPTRSLAVAQRAMVGNPKFVHPYYWAGYVLTGGGRFGS